MTAPATGTAAGLLALDAAYRAAIAMTSLQVVRAMVSVWNTVDRDNLAGTSEEWLTAAVARVLAGQRDAQIIADAYASRVRRIAAPNAPLFTPPNPNPPNAEQVRNSLIFTGPASAGRELGRAEAVYRESILDPETTFEDRQAEKQTLEIVKREVMNKAIARASGAATRHVTTAGRDQLENFVRTDKVAQGWVRVTKAGCCYYCAMLASRGPVYKEDSFAKSDPRFKNHPVNGASDQKVHDNCGCGLRPWYGAGEDLPERVAEFEQQWIDFTEGYSMDAAIRRFRQGYEGRLPRSQ